MSWPEWSDYPGDSDQLARRERVRAMLALAGMFVAAVLLLLR